MLRYSGADDCFGFGINHWKNYLNFHLEINCSIFHRAFLKKLSETWLTYEYVYGSGLAYLLSTYSDNIPAILLDVTKANGLPAFINYYIYWNYF